MQEASIKHLARDGSRVGSPRLLRVVAVASRSGRYGGPFDSASRQVQALRASGLAVRMLAGTFRGDAPASETLAPGRYVRVRSLRPRSFVTTFSLRMVAAIVSEVRHADIVHVSFAREPIPLLVALTSVLARRKLVLQPHGMLTSRTSRAHRLVDLLAVRPLFRRASAVIALSDVESGDLDRWNAAPAPATHVLGNPLPPGLLGPAVARELPPPEEVRVLFVARLHPRKRVGDFARAAAAAASAGMQWSWIVVGPDEGEGELLRRAAATTSTLQYLGACSADEVLVELERATVFVMPSEREPWGNVLASAVALGIPSVVARSAALAPSIEDFAAGRAVSDGDHAALFEAVRALGEAGAYRAASEGAMRMRTAILDPEALRRRLLAVITGL